MTRSILKEKKLPHTLWGEIVVTASYVLNRCPTKKLKETIPFQKWTGDKQSVRHFRVFGFVCYKNVLGATKNKLNYRSKVMLLIGYHITCVYKLYCPITSGTTISEASASESEHYFGI